MDFSTADDLCEHSGHDWLNAGGGMEICGVCSEERWAETEWVCQCGWRSKTRPAYALCCSTTHPPAINACMTEHLLMTDLEAREA